LGNGVRVEDGELLANLRLKLRDEAIKDNVRVQPKMQL